MVSALCELFSYTTTGVDFCRRLSVHGTVGFYWIPLERRVTTSLVKSLGPSHAHALNSLLDDNKFCILVRAVPACYMCEREIDPFLVSFFECYYLLTDSWAERSTRPWGTCGFPLKWCQKKPNRDVFLSRQKKSMATSGMDGQL
jgi:hypothetical protein